MADQLESTTSRQPDSDRTRPSQRRLAGRHLVPRPSQHHCRPPSQQDLFGLDTVEGTSLPGISERLLEPAASNPSWAIGSNQSAIIATLMQHIGAVRRRPREARSWIIDEEPLDEGDGWQDWPDFHRVTPERKARVHFLVAQPDTYQVEHDLWGVSDIIASAVGTARAGAPHYREAMGHLITEIEVGLR